MTELWQLHATARAGWQSVTPALDLVGYIQVSPTATGSSAAGSPSSPPTR